MFAIPGVLALIFLVYVHPQDIFLRLRFVPLLNYSFGAALLGLIVDVRLRLTRLNVMPLIIWSGLFFGWAILMLALSDPSKLSEAVAFLAIPFALFVIIALGAQSFRAVQAIAAVLLAIALYIAAIGIHQRVAPLGCFGYQASAAMDSATYDGRPCEDVRDCEPGEPGNAYWCEHVGVLGTSSITLRVRYLGFLNDPNEVAMAISMVVPFAFAFFLMRRSTARLLLLIVTLAMVVLCTIFTQSRGGQLVFLTVNAVYFVRRYGVRGLVLGMLLALPTMMVGGRDAEEAGASSHERVELLSTAMELFRAHPVFGIGYSNFGEFSRHTAHNSYALAAAELGFFGLFIWTALLYLCLKTTFVAIGRYAGRPEAEAAYVWSGALFSAQCGLVVGIFFLSFNYSSILWVFLGVCGALYGATQRHDPDYHVSLDWRDLRRIFVFNVVFLVLMMVYTRLATSS